MKVSKSLLAVIAMAGTMGFSAVASAMDFSVYGSLRGGLRQVDTDDSKAVGTVTRTNAAGAVVAAGSEAATDTLAFTATDPQPKVGKVGNIDLRHSNEADAGAGGTASGATVTGDVEAADAQLELGHGHFGSRIGIKGSEDLGNGAEAGLRWETAVGADGSLENDDADKTLGRLANVWYSGAFGKITIGQQNNPYRNAANWDQSWWYGGNNRYGDGGSRLQGVRYDGEAGAFNFSVMATAENKNTDKAGGAYVVSGHSAVAAGTALNIAVAEGKFSRTYTTKEVESETSLDSIIATGHYDMGVATINLGYRTNNVESNELGSSYDNFVISANGVLDALDWYIAFESNTDNFSGATKGDLGGAYVDANAITDNEKAAVGEIDAFGDEYFAGQDVSTIGLFLGYNISDVSKVYFEWEDSANDGIDRAGDNLDKTATLLGFSRSFGPNTSFIAEYVAVDNGSEYQADTSTLVGQLKVDF